MFRQYAISQLTAVDAAGTVMSSEPISGLLQAVHLTNNCSGTVTVATATAPAITLLTATAAGTQWYYPRAQAHNAGTGGTLAYADGYAVAVPIALSGDYVTVVTDAGGTVTAKILVQQ